MKKILTIAIVLLIGLTFTSCGDNKTESQSADPAPAANAPATPATTAAVEHYICPAGHIGFGGAAQGNCSQCGAALAHNQAFHANDPVNTTQPPGGPTATPTAPAQNANGDYHYTCSNGCAGGAGAQGNCATCGAALAHNQAYHN